MTDNYDTLLSCTAVVQASDSMTTFFLLLAYDDCFSALFTFSHLNEQIILFSVKVPG